MGILPNRKIALTLVEAVWTKRTQDLLHKMASCFSEVVPKITVTASCEYILAKELGWYRGMGNQASTMQSNTEKLEKKFALFSQTSEMLWNF